MDKQKKHGNNEGGVWAVEGRVEKLKDLHAKRLSAGKIAAMLGDGITRNAVIGKLHRIGLRPDSQPGGGFARGRHRATPAQRKARREAADRFNGRGKEPMAPNAPPRFRAKPHEYGSKFVELVIPEAERKSLAQLESGDCRWPIGDPQKPDFHFCAKPITPGTCYCLYHAQAAYVPAPKPLRRRPARLVEVEQGETV